MRLFKRNNVDQAAIPEDLQPYYNGNRSGMRAWLGPVLRGLALLVVLVLIVGGGVWAVRQVTNNHKDSDKPSGQSAQTNGKSTNGTSNSTATSSTSTDKTKSTGNTAKPAPSPSPVASNPTPAPSTTTKPSPATPSPTPAPKASTTPTPAVTPSPTVSAPATTTPGSGGGTAAGTQTLANTGPGETALALFVGTSVMAATLYRFVLIRRVNG